MILITGGAGYLGSHACVALDSAGYQTLVFDDLSNSTVESVDNISLLCKNNKPVFIEGDIRSAKLVATIFKDYPISAVMHFAGLKSVANSQTDQAQYYSVNVGGSINLLQAMVSAGVTRLVFSSSATVYGHQANPPYTEDHPLNPVNTYGHTKLAVERILNDLHSGVYPWSIGILRYFNPVGAHPSGLLGDNPVGPPNNLFPHITECIASSSKSINVFGGDYETPDGTGIRDYIHVLDLIEAHMLTMNYLITNPGEQLTINLGTGRGISVLQVIEMFSKVSGKDIPYQILDRRTGDIDASWASADLAFKKLNWRASHSLEDMCRDSWTSQQKKLGK